MLIDLDDNFLDSVGLAEMPDDEKGAFLVHVYKELEVRVGEALGGVLNEAQLREFEALVRASNKDAVTAWLQQYCPNYEQVITQQLEELKAELQANKGRLLDPAA